VVTSISSGSSIAVSLPGHKTRKEAGNDLYISITSFSQRISDLQKAKKPVNLIQKTPDGLLENFKKRARAKYLTRAVVSKLVDVKGSPLTKSYWNTWHCSTILYSHSGKLVSKYCKQRWCVVCSRVRTAQIIKQYLPTFRQWEGKVFVTLTIPNCSASQLKGAVQGMAKTFDRIRKQLDNAYRRNKTGLVIKGLRKLEVTYNPDKRNYHPHYHLIMESREAANVLREKWLEHYQDAVWKAQDVKAADDNSCMELCKYFTKLISSHSKDRVIHVKALDTIFQAVSRRRTMQAYGGLKVEKEISDDEADALAEEMGLDSVYEWQQSVADWVNQSTGELLTHHQPDDELRRLVEHGITFKMKPPLPAEVS
jgi:hypothetical protein